jgi:NADP-dependent 3-hydroxy acid dehydrogenase YdfG
MQTHGTHARERVANSGLRGKVALITGASSGIGEATARALAKRGCALALAARRLDRLQALAQALEEAGGQALPLALDVTRQEQVDSAIQLALDRLGGIDIAFCNAGIGRMDWLEDLDPGEGIQRQIDVNLVGTIRVARAVLPHMQSRRHGHIILMASLAGLIGSPTYSVYAASKFGVRGFAEALRREVTPWGIRVSVVFPGAVRTGFVSDAVARRHTGITTPRALVLDVEEVGETVARLAIHPRRQVVLPRVAWLAIWADRLLPGVIDSVVGRFFVRRERSMLG